VDGLGRSFSIGIKLGVLVFEVPESGCCRFFFLNALKVLQFCSILRFRWAIYVRLLLGEEDARAVCLVLLCFGEDFPVCKEGILDLAFRRRDSVSDEVPGFGLRCIIADFWKWLFLGLLGFGTQLPEMLEETIDGVAARGTLPPIWI
jgi:hypothetical protein